MRIGMIADLYKPHVSGVTNWVSLNKQVLERLGHEVSVFTFGDLGYDDGEQNVVRSPGIPVGETGAHLALGYSSRARRLLQSMDIVHVHHPFLGGPLALRYCRPFNIPIVFTHHTRYDLYTRAYLPFVPEPIGSLFFQAYMPWFCRRMDLVIAPSGGIKQVLDAQHVRSPVVVLPNGVDLAPFKRIDGPVDRRTLEVPEGGVLLVYVGRLGPEKNLDLLLQAFAGVSASMPEARLMLLGDGPERGHLETEVERMQLSGRVRFVGRVDYAQVPHYLAAADAFVTASVTEGHPLTLIEAMAAGLPALGIRSPGIEDTILDGETGYLSSGDLDTFTGLMRKLAGDEGQRRAMGAQARAEAEKYSIEMTCGRLLEWYQRLVLQRPRRAQPRRWLAVSNRRLDPWT